MGREGTGVRVVSKSTVEISFTYQGQRCRERLKVKPTPANLKRAQKQWTFLEGEYIFHNPRTNKPWEGDQPIRKTLWTHALKKAGVTYRNPYQTRHTYASMMLFSGEHPMWVSHKWDTQTGQ